ncbi:SET domain protein 25 isoform X4 [Carex rostrata]
MAHVGFSLPRVSAPICSAPVDSMAPSTSEGGGFMYANQTGQLCGPYMPNQLLEGLSMGFLPSQLAVYPILKGKLGNPFHLMYLTQYLNGQASSSTGDETCWLYEDDGGTRHGPHSIAELSYWHENSHLQGSCMVYHVAHKCGPFTLVTLIDKWSKGEVTNLLNAVPDEATYLAKFKSDVGKEVSRQLHAAIMKSARRFLIDEVIRDVVPDLIATKKAQRELDRAQKCKPAAVVEEKYELVGEQVTAPASVSTEVNPIQERILPSISYYLYYDIMKVVWDSVFSDLLSEHCEEWLRRKRSALPSRASIISRCIQKQDDVQAQHNLSTEDIEVPPGFESHRASSHAASSSFGIYKEIKGGLKNALFVAAKESISKHFQQVISDELTKLLCPGTRSHTHLAEILDESNQQEKEKVTLSTPARSDNILSKEPEPACCPEEGKNAKDKKNEEEEKNVQEEKNKEKEKIAPYICYASAFERLGISTINTSVREITTEEQPPGFEEISPSQASLFGITKFHPSKFGEGESVITKNITLAVCRQKVHNEVMKELRSLFSDSLDTCFTSWQSSKQKDSLNLIDDKTVVRYKRRRKFSNAVSSSTGDQTSTKPLNRLVELSVGETKADSQPTSQTTPPKKTTKRKKLEVQSSSHTKKSRKDVPINKKRKASLVKVKEISAIKAPSQDERTQAVVKKMTSSLNKNVQKEKKVSQVKQKGATGTKEKKGRRLPEKKTKPILPSPVSEGCARVSIDGWEWRNWSRNATPAERARVRGPRGQTGYLRNGKADSKLSPHLLKGPSARTNRAKMRHLLAAVEGTDLLKISQLSSAHAGDGA